jgi:CRP-like cAMP-binding protein
MSLSRHPSFPLALQPCVSQLDLQPAQTVFRAGAPPRYIHFIEEGAVRLVRHGRQGE